MKLEQAVFTSIEGARRCGYQVAAATDGLQPEDLRALSQWGPAHDSLREDHPFAESFQFHALPSGAACLARTTYQGREYSGRGGGRVFTHSVVVPREVLRRFANHPFRVWEALAAAGRFVDSEHAPLAPFELPGTASVIRPDDLVRLEREPGRDRLLRLRSRIADAGPSVLVTEHSATRLLRGLFDLLPVARRADYSFCTGLRDSPRRPFRLLVVERAGSAERRQWRRAGREVLEWTEADGPADHAQEPLDAESARLAQCWAAARWDELAAQVAP